MTGNTGEVAIHLRVQAKGRQGHSTDPRLIYGENIDPLNKFSMTGQGNSADCDIAYGGKEETKNK
jgi:hypothetical protein